MAPRLITPFTFFLDWGFSVMDFWLGQGAPAVRRGMTSDAAELSALHATSFAHPWSVLTMEQMLTDRAIHAHVAAAARVSGFILSRVVVDEAEILSVAVATGARRSGVGRKLVEANLDSLVLARVSQVFLEVEAGNVAAIALYQRLGFVEIGRRKGYYRGPGGQKDALTMRLDLKRRSARPPALDG